MHGMVAELGSKDGRDAFEGGVREFLFANEFVSLKQAQTIKNLYKNYQHEIMGYYRFREGNTLGDEFRS